MNHLVTVLVATRNLGKQAEVKELLSDLPLSLVFPDDLSSLTDFYPEEIGDTFAQVAINKALAFASRSGLPTVADDSGLMITALNGFPGVHSRRFVTDPQRNRIQTLLARLANYSDRSAQLVTAISYIDTDSSISPQTFLGTITGQIAQEPMGEAGFDYDAIFIPTGRRRTFGQLGTKIKNQLSHRSQAINQLKIFLRDLLRNKSHA